MPYVNVKSAGKLSAEQKEKLAKAITDALETIAGKPRQYTYIVFEDVPYDDWAIAGKLLGGSSS